MSLPLQITERLATTAPGRSGRRARGRRLLLSVLLFGSLADCRQVLGVEDRRTGDAGTASGGDAGDAAAEGGACGGFAFGAACAACTMQHCCTEASACRADTRCAPSYDCAAVCDGSDEACRAACVSVRGDAMADLASCQWSSCATECGLSCGGMAGLFEARLVNRSAECRGCLNAHVCDEHAVCAGVVDCLRETTCQEDCTPFDVNCFVTCGPEYPDGEQLYLALNNGYSGRCRKECMLGTNWSCIGNVSWPQSTTPGAPIDYKTKFLGYSLAGPIAGLTVRACNKASGDCAGAVPTGTTGSDGFVTLHLGSNAFDGYLFLTGSGVYPALVYRQPHVVQSVNEDEFFFRAETVPSAADVSTLLQLIGATVDSARAVLILSMLDCDGYTAPGVTFASSAADGSTVGFYTASGVPATASVVTDVDGSGGFVNVPPGLVTVTASVASIGVVGRATVWARPGSQTLADLVPAQ